MDLVELFGKTVSGTYRKHPAFARGLIKLGYGFEQMMFDKKPDPSLTDAQNYMTQKCMYYTRMPLARPAASALVNLFTPCEMIHSQGLFPQCAEGYSSYLSGGKCEKGFLEYAEMLGIADTYCSYHKAMIGACRTGVLPKPRFMVTTTTVCDANVLTFKYLSEAMNVPLFVIDVPYTYSAEAEKYVRDQLLKLRDFISAQTGRPYDDDALSERVAATRRTMLMYGEFLDELARAYYPNTVTMEMYRVLMHHILMGTPETETFMRMQLDEIRAQKRPDAKNRLIWCHVLPYYSDCLRSSLNGDPDLQLLVSDMNFDYLEAPEDDVYGFMAKRLIDTSFNGNSERRENTFLEMAERLSADCAVIFSHWGCKQTAGSVYSLRDRLSDAGIKALVLDGDACDRRNHAEQQMKTRLCAFREMLEAGS